MKEIALVFFRLGAFAFGGPAAHIAMMEEEVVRRRKWLTSEHFLDLLGITNLIPGPNSTELAIHIGYMRAGWKGLMVAGICFILPATVITLALAYVYVTYGTAPQLQPFVEGIRPAIIAVIVAAVYRLGKPISKNPFQAVVFLLVVVANLLGADEILLLFAGGVVGVLWKYRHHFRQTVSAIALLFPGSAMQSPDHSTLPAVGASLAALGLFFLKIGAILYGSGYVLVAFLREGLVETNHWLTEAQLLDAVAIGQFTPGPVLSTATFIGYVVLGFPGALVATTGIFLPSFVFVYLVNPLVPKLRKWKPAAGFLEGVTAASLGLMFSVSLMLSATVLTYVTGWILFISAILATLLWRVNAAWIIIGTALAHWLIQLW